MLLAALAAYALTPPAHQTLVAEEGSGAPAGVRGVIHVHSTRSDGTGSVDEIAAAAAQAGLRFVVVTDHGDGTRSPALPRYLSGVLCIDGFEVSTEDGHVLALGIGRTPYRLAGDGRGVVEDIARLGGTSIVAAAWYRVSPSLAMWSSSVWSRLRTRAASKRSMKVWLEDSVPPKLTSAAMGPS